MMLGVDTVSLAVVGLHNRIVAKQRVVNGGYEQQSQNGVTNVSREHES